MAGLKNRLVIQNRGGLQAAEAATDDNDSRNVLLHVYKKTG
jgi:hypothetical protein